MSTVACPAIKPDKSRCLWIGKKITAPKEAALLTRQIKYTC